MEQSQIPPPSPQLPNHNNSPGTSTVTNKGGEDATATTREEDGPASSPTKEETSHLDVSACDTSRESDLSTTASPEREFSIRATNFDRGQLKLRIASKRVNKKTTNTPGGSGSINNKESVSSPDSGDNESTEVFKPTTKGTDIAQDNLDVSDIKEASASKKISPQKERDVEVEKCSSSSPPSPPALISRNTGPPIYPVHVDYSSYEKRDGRRTHSPSQDSERSRSKSDHVRLSREEEVFESTAMPSMTRERSGSARGDPPADANVQSVLDEGVDTAKSTSNSSYKSSKEGHHSNNSSKQAKESTSKTKPSQSKSKQSPSIMSSLKSKKGASGATKSTEQGSSSRSVRKGADSDSDVDDVPLQVVRNTLRDSPSMESTTSTGSREGSQRQRKAQSKSQSDQNKLSGPRTNGTATGTSKPVPVSKSRTMDAPSSSSARTSALNGDVQLNRTSVENYDTDKVKRKRGRPPKQPTSTSATVSRPMDLEHLNMPNVSPDSGIQSIAGSPLTHDREVPSPGHHHPAMHPVPTAAAHPGLHFPPEIFHNPANFNAFHRLYPHLNPSIASLYHQPFASPFFIHPAVNNFQQAFLNFTNNQQRFSSIANPGSMDHSPVKQPEISRSKSSEELNIPTPKSQSSKHSKSQSFHRPDKHDRQSDKHFSSSSSRPTSNTRDQVEPNKESSAMPDKKRVGRPRKNPESTVVHSPSQEMVQKDKSDKTALNDNGATDNILTDKSKPVKSSSVHTSSSAKSSPKQPQSSMEKPKRGRPPRDAMRQKHGQLKSSTVSTSPLSNPLDYLATVPVATNSLPGSSRKTNEMLSVSIPSAESLIPKDSAIALATSFSEQDFSHRRSPSNASPSHVQAQLSSRAATQGTTSTATTSTSQAQDSAFATSAIGLPPKKKRGRPRKNPLPEDAEASKGTLSPKSTTSQQSRDSTMSPNSLVNAGISALSPTSNSSTTTASSVPIIPKTTKKTPIVAPSSFGLVPSRPAPSSIARKRYKSGTGSDAEILSLAQNIHDSISAQFTSEDELNSSSENLERGRLLLQRNIFTDINHDFQHNFHGRPSLLQKQQTRPEGSSRKDGESGAQGSESPKKKSKKPKLHVMMRKPKKRGRKKKVATLSSPAPESPAAASEELREEEVVTTPPRASISSPKKRGKTPPVLQKSPPRVSRIKSRSGKSENSDSGMATDTSDMDKNAQMPVLSPVAKKLHSPDSKGEILYRFKSKKKKKKQKMYLKSKHKNIVDPVFLADLEGCTQDFGMMGISENPEHYLMRLQPGEIPMPSMFKIHRLIVKRRRKNKDLHLSKFRRLESKKDYADFAAVVRERSKRGRKKKFLSEEYVSEKEDEDAHVNVEQCLPPKKRHKLLAQVENEPLENPDMRMGSANEPIVLDVDEPVASTSAAGDLQAFAAAGGPSSPGLSTESTFTTKPTEKRKVGRPRKTQSQTTEPPETQKEKTLPPPPPLVPLSVAVSTTTSPGVDAGLSPKASSLTDTPPAKLIPGTESGAHIPKEPFRRRKVSEVRRKDSSSGPEPSGTAKSKKRTASSGSGSTQEITITRVTHPKKVESAVIEVQTDFDDDIREIKVIPGVSSRFARSTSIGTDSNTATSARRINRVTQESTLSPVLCESETQVESTEIGVQHAEVGIGTETEPPLETKKTTVDIGIQTGNPEEHEHQESPRMMSIAIQAEEEETMKSVGVGDSPPPQETVNEMPSSRATTRLRQRTQPDVPIVESLPVSLPISGLTLNSGSQNGHSRTESGSSNKKQKSKSSHSSTTDNGDGSKEQKSQESRDNAEEQPVKPKQGRGRPPKSQRKRTDSPSVGREQVTSADSPVHERNTDMETNSVGHSSSAAGAAHVSVIKRTPEKRGGSRPFPRPVDLPLPVPAIDTAQIASLLNESPPETEKVAKKAKSPGRSPGRSPAARLNDRQPSGASNHRDSQSSTVENNAVSNANVTHADAEVHIQENSESTQEQPPPKKGRGRPKKNLNGKRPVGRPRKNQSSETPKPPENQIRDNSDGSESGSPKRKRAKAADESPTRINLKKHSSEKGNNKVQNKKRKEPTDDGEVDSEVEEITRNAQKEKGKKKKSRGMMIPPAFPDKDPYEFDALSVSDFEPLPDLRQKRKRRKSKGFDFELESRRKKKKKKKPSTPEDSDIEEISSEDEDEEETNDTETSSYVDSARSTPIPGATPSKKGRPEGMPKKRFQKAGLFSNTYKDEDLFADKRKSMNGEGNGGKQKLVYNAEDHEHGLLPEPLHFGRYMREKRIAFQLPYDLWWLSENSLLKPARTSPKYKKIRTNVFVDAKPTEKHFEPHACNCEKPNNSDILGCSEGCLNRMVYIECTPNVCPCGDQCSNQRMQRHQWHKGLEKFQTEKRGHGVRATSLVQSGQFLLEYLGEVVSEKEFQRRMTEEYLHERHHYCMNLDYGMVIDGYRMGNIGRFVNHSCEPNCEMVKWNVNGIYRMGLFSLRDIEPGEELSYDYNFYSYNNDAQQDCFCGSENCRGIIGGKHNNRKNGQVVDKAGRPVGRPPKDKRKSNYRLKKYKEKKAMEQKQFQPTPVKPMSHRERCFAQKHAIFLLRNIDKVRHSRQKGPGAETPDTPVSKEDAFMAHFQALKTLRSVRTRRLAYAADNTELACTAKLAQIFKEIYQAVATYKEDDMVLSTNLMTCPNRKKNPDYYEQIKDPIDLTTIEKNILTGQYTNVEDFEKDFLKLFENVEKYCGKKSGMGKYVSRLRKVFMKQKEELMGLIEFIVAEAIEEATENAAKNSNFNRSLSHASSTTSMQSSSQSVDSPISAISEVEEENREPKDKEVENRKSDKSEDSGDNNKEEENNKEKTPENGSCAENEKEETHNKEGKVGESPERACDKSVEIIEKSDKAPTISVSDESDELNTTKDSIGSESVLEVSRDGPVAQKDEHNDSTETEPAVDNSMEIDENSGQENEASETEASKESEHSEENKERSESSEGGNTREDTDKEHDKSMDSINTDTTNESVKSNTNVSCTGSCALNSGSGTTSTSGSTCGSQCGRSTNAPPSEYDPSELEDLRFVQEEPMGDEEVIRCICNIFKDEGKMIMCDKCEVWQHCDCMGVSDDIDNYLCEQCDPRPVNKEIVMVPQPAERIPGCTYYMTLLRGELQVKHDDCIYINRDSLPKKTPYTELTHIPTEKLDIFRIERLWEDEKGEKFVWGFHYFRPHETFHEASRKFYRNELFRVPIYEIVPIECIIGTCAVLDIQTYCKGRPKGVKEQDAYVCEYRLDKTAHYFHKISRNNHPVNTRVYCFNNFLNKLQPKRNFMPHPDESAEMAAKFSKGGKPLTTEDGNESDNTSQEHDETSSTLPNSESKAASDEEEDLPLVRVRQEKRQKQKARLNSFLDRLHSNFSDKTKERLDATYLLAEKRVKRRKEPYSPSTP